jgi:hypothetical protein
VTKDPRATRFHACERFARCEYVNTSFANSDELRRGAPVIYVNPVTMSVEQWEAYSVVTKEMLKSGVNASNLVRGLNYGILTFFRLTVFNSWCLYPDIRLCPSFKHLSHYSARGE